MNEDGIWEGGYIDYRPPWLRRFLFEEQEGGLNAAHALPCIKDQAVKMRRPNPRKSRFQIETERQLRDKDIIANDRESLNVRNSFDHEIMKSTQSEENKCEENDKFYDLERYGKDEEDENFGTFSMIENEALLVETVNPLFNRDAAATSTMSRDELIKYRSDTVRSKLLQARKVQRNIKGGTLATVPSIIFNKAC